jgi:hypothetical protein
MPDASQGTTAGCTDVNSQRQKLEMDRWFKSSPRNHPNALFLPAEQVPLSNRDVVACVARLLRKHLDSRDVLRKLGLGTLNVRGEQSPDVSQALGDEMAYLSDL